MKIVVLNLNRNHSLVSYVNENCGKHEGVTGFRNNLDSSALGVGDFKSLGFGGDRGTNNTLQRRFLHKL